MIPSLVRQVSGLGPIYAPRVTTHGDRAPLDPERLRSHLIAPGGPYTALGVVSSTGSTNSDLASAARAGSPDRSVLIAEQQTAGRGRQTRQWVSPAGAGLYLSVLLREPDLSPSRLGWLPLLAGVAVQRTVRDIAGVHATLKWPNDVLAGPEQRKCCGILAEVVTGRPEPTAVVGIGLNVSHRPDELPAGAGGLPATSLALEGGLPDRERLAVALLLELDRLARDWRAAAGDPLASGLMDAYRLGCSTIGAQVRVELPRGAERTEILGTATDIDAEGRLVVLSADGRHAVSAGDVVHVRPQA